MSGDPREHLDEMAAACSNAAGGCLLWGLALALLLALAGIGLYVNAA